jgi:hypothetical protein
VRTTIVSALVLVLVLAADSRAATEVLTFDDLVTSCNQPLCGVYPIPNGYGGLNWQNFYEDTRLLYDPNGVGSGFATTVFNGPLPSGSSRTLGQPALIYASAGTTFNINSVDMTGVYADDFHVEAVGYRGGTVVYDNIFVVNSSGPTLLSLNYLNVKSVNFIPLFGTPISDLGSNVFVIDNLSVTVPEPALPSLAACAAVVVALSRRRSEHELPQ